MTTRSHLSAERLADIKQGGNYTLDEHRAICEAAEEAVRVRNFLRRLDEGILVGSHAFSAEEITYARAQDRMLVTSDGHGYIHVRGAAKLGYDKLRGALQLILHKIREGAPGQNEDLEAIAAEALKR